MNDHIRAVLFLIGKQGCGKKTQANFVATEFRYLHVDMGAMIRQILEERKNDPNQELVEKGNLFPDTEVFPLYENMVEEACDTCHSGVILDGVPRTVDQAKYVLKDLKKRFPKAVYAAVNIEIPDHEAVKRIKNRARHEGRSDDLSEEAVQQRLQIYTNETTPVLDFFEKDPDVEVYPVAGLRSIAEIRHRVFEIVNGMMMASMNDAEFSLEGSAQK